MTAGADPRPALAIGLAVLAAGAVMALDRAGALVLGWGWALALACLVAGIALVAVARESEAAYAGVLARVADRRRLPLPALRALVVTTAPLAGAGVAAYAGLALVQTLAGERGGDADVDWRRSTGTALIGLAALLACDRLGLRLGSDALLWSVALAGSGLSLYWRLPDARSARWGPDAEQRWRLALVLSIGAAVFVLDQTGLFSQAARTIAGAAAATAVLALVWGPRWLVTLRALARERVAAARASERAELAEHLHDSVLQTLALVQDRADDPDEVRALARRQERDLRAWLLEGPVAVGGPRHSIATALRAVAAEIEDAYRAEIEVVCVGDALLAPDVEPLIAAAREALVNAAKHAGGSTVSLFVEIAERRVAAYVRDRGPGFDLDAIPADRRGVRDSILGRMRRHGGQAVVRSAPGGGSEVRIVQERGP